MDSISIKRAARNVNSSAIAADWLSLGIYPIPLAPRTKRPKGGKGWNTLRVTKKTIDQFFSPGDNVGGLWGAPSNWVVDIDLDWDESVAAAAVLLPETFRYGRHSRPNSHYLYRCEGMSGTKFHAIGTLDTDGVTKINEGSIVEIRSTGSQSVLPPSIHPENERYEINSDVPIRSISRLQLERYVRYTAAAAILARHYPHAGARHDYVHTVAGTLLHTGWETSMVRTFMKAMLEASDAKEDDRRQRDRTVTNTIEKFREGERIAGWRTLSQWLPGKDLDSLRKWLEPQKRLIEIVSNEDVLPDRENKEVKPPEESLEVPGLVGDVAKWAGARSFAQQPLFNLAAGLTIVALASGNKYIVDGWDTPLQPYFLMLAPTASGKESALDSIATAAKRIEMQGTIFQGFQSYHAMLDTIATPPNVGCWLWDEAARKIKTAMRSQGSQDYQIITHLLSLYGKGNSSVAGIPGRKQAISAIDRPFLIITAAAQPSQLIEAITDSDISLGLINRFVLFDAGNHLPDTNHDRKLIFPAHLEDSLKEFRNVKGKVNGSEFPVIRVRLDTTETYAIFRDFHERCRELAIKGGGWEMWGRANQNALICAGLVAIGINAKRPSITVEVARWAIRLLEWTSDRWVQRIEECSSRSAHEEHSKYLERAIRTAREFVHRALGHPQELKALRNGYMPRSTLTRISRHIRGKDLEETLATLVTSDLIRFGEVDGVECYWSK